MTLSKPAVRRGSGKGKDMSKSALISGMWTAAGMIAPIAAMMLVWGKWDWPIFGVIAALAVALGLVNYQGAVLRERQHRLGPPEPRL